MFSNKHEIQESIDYIFKSRNPHVAEFKNFIKKQIDEEFSYLTSCPDETASNEKMRYISGRASALKDILKLIG